MSAAQEINVNQQKLENMSVGSTEGKSSTTLILRKQKQVYQRKATMKITYLNMVLTSKVGVNITVPPKNFTCGFVI